MFREVMGGLLWPVLWIELAFGPGGPEGPEGPFQPLLAAPSEVRIAGPGGPEGPEGPFQPLPRKPKTTKPFRV